MWKDGEYLAEDSTGSVEDANNFVRRAAEVNRTEQLKTTVNSLELLDDLLPDFR